jgi:hypothetical protein
MYNIEYLSVVLVIFVIFIHVHVYNNVALTLIIC